MHVNGVHIISMRNGLNKGITVGRGEKKKGLDFDALMSIAQGADYLNFQQIVDYSVGHIVCDSSEMFKYLEDNFETFFAATSVIIVTKPLDEIRAIAKELRSDVSVSKAAKAPAKPKASYLKDRRDVI